MIVERDGRLGVTQEHLRELSKESRALSTRRDGDYKGRFLLAQDGTVTVDFDPWEPTIRRGDDPDALVHAMANAGFTIPSDPDEDYQDSRGTEAAFALIESVTGITMIRDQLQSTSYVIVTFPDHHYQGPGPINPGVKPRTDLPG